MILGLDVSTSITGATVLDGDGHCIYNEFWDTRNKKHFPSLYNKASHISERLQELKSRYDIQFVFIEQSLQSFRSGFSSAQTLSTLSRFNGMTSLLCWQIFEKQPELLSAQSARKSVGIVVPKGQKAKQKSFEFVLASEPSFVVEYTKSGNPKPGTMDKSDSWVIAKAGYNECLKKNLVSLREA